MTRASSALAGFRSTCSPRQITTGVSAGAMPSPRSSCSASVSSSRSIHLCGSRFLAASSRSRRVSAEKREPMILNPVLHSIRIERRILPGAWQLGLDDVCVLGLLHVSQRDEAVISPALDLSPALQEPVEVRVHALEVV